MSLHEKARQARGTLIAARTLPAEHEVAIPHLDHVREGCAQAISKFFETFLAPVEDADFSDEARSLFLRQINNIGSFLHDCAAADDESLTRDIREQAAGRALDFYIIQCDRLIERIMEREGLPGPPPPALPGGTGHKGGGGGAGGRDPQP